LIACIVVAAQILSYLGIDRECFCGRCSLHFYVRVGYPDMMASFTAVARAYMSLVGYGRGCLGMWELEVSCCLYSWRDTERQEGMNVGEVWA
jgi:hypothetical protein